MTIIPAIDIIDGKCVRLTKGDYSKKNIYNEEFNIFITGLTYDFFLNSG